MDEDVKRQRGILSKPTRVFGQSYNLAEEILNLELKTHF
ncbi:hypothetical protein CsSME_00038695 [Camellia sinensis var. sinensis]